MRAFFSLDIFQAGAMKGLNLYLNLDLTLQTF